MRIILNLLLLVTVQLSAATLPHADSNARGAIATVNPLATKVGMNVLNSGGNAIDAAVAAALALGVVDSHNSGIGGGNLGVIRWADGEVEAIDGRETAPAKAHRDMYIVDGHAKTEWSKTGALAVGVPGSLKMYDYIISKGGKKIWQS